MSERENIDLQAEASALRQLATALVFELRIARTDAYGSDHAETADIFDVAASVLDNRRAGQPLLEEIARLREQLDDVMRAGDLEHARMAALIEACEATAAFIESYTPDSDLARRAPGFYGIFRVYGKNARAAVNAVRAQADALLARLRDADALADAVAAYHDASRTAEIDPTMKPDEARRMYDLGRAWAAYEQTREARIE